MQNIINVAEIADQDWDFIERYYPPGKVDWKYYSASPQNIVERSITRPKIGRYKTLLAAFSD